MTQDAFWQGRRTLITGGAGFVGSNLAAWLVAKGARVRVADNLERGRREYLAPVARDIEFCECDLRTGEACMRMCADMEVVFHLASKVGGIGYYLQYPGTVIADNMLMDLLMLKAASACGVQRYLYASSGHIYPIELQMAPDAPPIREDQACPANPELSYGWAKLMGEKLIEYHLAEQHDLRASVVRLVGAFGKNQDIELETGSAIPVFCRRAAEYPATPFVVWGTGVETRSYCYIDDVLDGMVRSVELLDRHEVIGPFNLGAEGRITIGDLARMVVEVSGKKINLAFDPTKKTAIWGQAVDCSLARKLLEGWNARTSLREGVSRIYASIEERLHTRGTS